MTSVDSAFPLIRLTSVQKRFVLPDGVIFDAVKDVSLDIPAGAIYGLIGKSGAGKSTLMRLINLLETPDAGQVFVDGKDLTKLSKNALRATRQTMGMIFQQFNLLQNASVYDNIAFPLKLHGNFTAAEIDARIHECLKIVNLSEKVDSFPAQLSGGQKQRVAIARALAPRPKVLLCDEPTSALDTETTRSVLDTLREINTKLGVTIVLVTHELSVVQALCNHVAVMEHGNLVEQFAVNDTATPRISMLGKELAQEQEHARIINAYANGELTAPLTSLQTQ